MVVVFEQNHPPQSNVFSIWEKNAQLSKTTVFWHKSFSSLQTFVIGCKKNKNENKTKRKYLISMSVNKLQKIKNKSNQIKNAM